MLVDLCVDERVRLSEGPRACGARRVLLGSLRVAGRRRALLSTADTAGTPRVAARFDIR